MLTLSLHAYGGNVDDDIHVIPFVKSSGLILVEAEFNGEKGHFIFDTGANAVLINGEESTDGSHTTSFQSLNGTFNAKEVSIPQLSLGSYSLFGLTAFTADLSKFHKITGKNILGIIGAKPFNAELLRIDNVKKTIELLPKRIMPHLNNSLNNSCPIRFENDIPVIDVTIEGETYSFGLDTGASTSLIDESFVSQQRPLFKQLDENFNLVTASDQSQNLKIYTLQPFMISKMRMENLSFGAYDFTEINQSFSKPLVGIISIDQLPVKELFLDFTEGQLYFLF